MLIYFEDGQASLFDQDFYAGKMSQGHSPVDSPKAKISVSFSKKLSELSSIPYLFLDLSEGVGNLLGESYWEILSPWRGDAWTLNTGVCPREGKESSLWQILEEQPHSKYYLTKKACLGILRRSMERGKELPLRLKEALEVQAGLRNTNMPPPVGASYRINQRNEGIDLGGLSGALMATQNMQMRSVVTQARQGVTDSDGENSILLGTQPEKQRTQIAADTPERELKERLNILCLNDQGGQVMHCSKNIAGTLRAQEHGHQPLLLESNQNHATVRTDGISTTLPASMGMGGGYVPMVYENHGIDARYKGPLDVVPTISARCGTGGNNVPLVGNNPEVFCIDGNTIDRQPQNGGNGIGYQKDIAYTLTATDHHAVFSRQRVDVFTENEVVSTESARQHKDATDLVAQPYQNVVGTLVRSDHKGIGNQYVSNDKCIVASKNLIRRLTPLECERLQGFPDHWTDIPGASDAARYKALGNSVAIPCVDYVMRGILLAIHNGNAA